jgi:hypothetical protein
MDKKTQAMLASYGRSFLAAVTTALMITNGDILALDGDVLKAILAAGISAVLPVAIRAANPKDPAFGKIADGVTEVVVGKLTAKKSAKKK